MTDVLHTLWHSLDPCPAGVKVYVLAVLALGVWTVWRIFGPRGSAW